MKISELFLRPNGLKSASAEQRVPEAPNEIDQFVDSVLFESLPLGICVCDATGSIKKFNAQAAKLWGREPLLFHGFEQFCGAFTIRNTEGTYLRHDETPVALTLKDGVERNGVELIFGKPDFTQSVVNINTILGRDSQGNITSVVGVFTDITAQRAAENALKLKTNELADHVDNGAVGLMWLNAEGIIKWVNKTELDMLGYSREEYIGQHISEFHTGRKASDIMDKLGTAGPLREYESELRCKDGSIKTVQISSNVFEKNGRLVHHRFFTVDTSGQKLLYNALNESAQQQTRLINALPAAVYTCDREGRITFFNEAAATLWGREPEIGKDLWCGSWKIFNPDGSAMGLDTCPMAITLKEGRKVFGKEILIERPDGSRRNVLPYPQPIFDVAGEMTGAMNMLVDVTELKKAQLLLIENENRFKLVADASPVLIYMSDVTNSNVYFNTGWLDFTGRTMQEESGDGWLTDVHPEDLPALLELFGQVFETEQEYKTEFRLRRKNGTYTWVYAHGTPHYSTNGAFAGYIGTAIDINDQKIRKEELEKNVSDRTSELIIANEKLEVSNKELEQFAYVASHDLQEPLRKITSFGDILINKYQDTLGDSGVDMLERMKSASFRMKILIDDLLAYSKITGDSEREVVNTSGQLEDVLNDLDTLITEKDAVIEAGNLYPILGYGLQIRQLFQNLIGNALKFSRPGVAPVIKITARLVLGSDTDFYLTKEEGTQQFQLIEIQDNGIGFKQEHASRIFQVFQRLHGKNEYAGSGVGLSIVQKVVQNHNGLIRASGNPGIGASFQILMPAIQN